MKLTNPLFKQHLGRFFKKHWRIQGSRTPRDTAAYKALAEHNIPIFDPKDILEEKQPEEKLNIVGLVPRELKPDNSHPKWKEVICHTYKNDNVLLEGLNQAKSLTKTVELHSGLPERIALKSSSKEIDGRVKRIILNSHLFDAEQVKLPIVKDPTRPAWNFPRTYGISDKRVNLLMISKLLQHLELLCGPQLSKDRYVLNDLEFSYPFEKSGKLIQLMLRGDTVLTASKPLKPISTTLGNEVELPDLYPIDDTITLNLEHIYDLRNVYPLSKNMTKYHPHTIFIHTNKTELQNIYEEPVTEEQILGHSLMKTFTAAAAYAKEQYGETVKNLPKPVTLQCVNTDGRLFHFGILQLNTLDLDSREGIKNLWHQTERIPLFESCSYILGKPTLSGYNNEVFRYLRALYENV